MLKTRESTSLNYPHDLHRRFKEDEYLLLDDSVAKVDQTCENRFMLAKKGIFDEKEKEGNIVEKQLLEYNLELEKLHQKGSALMTNIRLACEQRHLQQREKEKAYEEGILEYMQQKSLEVEEKLLSINDRWVKLKSRLDEEPMKFLKTLKILKNQILDLSKSKDDIIQTIKTDLKRINSTYHTVLEKQRIEQLDVDQHLDKSSAIHGMRQNEMKDYDLHYLMQRVNKYLSNLKESYVRQIFKLDDTINQFHQEEYDRLYRCRHEFSTEIIVGGEISKMLDNIDKKYEAEREYRVSLQAKFRELRIEYDEMTHAFKISMEKDQENIEMELEEKTSIYFLNSLKFNYNYQVLEKKNTENVNQMVYEDKKKHWLKLINNATELRKEIKEVKSSFGKQTFEIMDHTDKVRERLLKLEVKANNAAADNESKFQNILKMNIEEANNLISQICDFNKIFFEEHLGIRWEPPNLKTLDHSNLEALQRSNKMHPSASNKKEQCDTKIKDIVNGSDEWKMLQLIFEKMPGHLDYLIDKDIPTIMKLCETSEKGKKLAQLDNVFSALGIEHSENLSKLLENLLLFAYCPHRDKKKIVEIHQQEAIEGNISTSPPLTSTEKTFEPMVAQATSVDNVSIDLDLMRHIEDFNKIFKTDHFNQAKTTSDQLDINYAHILSALEMTIKSIQSEKLVEEEKDKMKNDVVYVAIDLELRKNQIELLWDRYRMVFPEEHIHMWSSLEQGLVDYLLHLKKRFQLHIECDGLRRQNAQLKYMLQELL